MCLDPCKAGHTLPEREVAVDVDGMCPLCMEKRIADLEAIIDKFVAGRQWASDAWKSEPEIAPLFADAEKRRR